MRWPAGSASRRMFDEHAPQPMQLAMPITAIPSMLSDRVSGEKVTINYTILE